ncbi:nourseothricin acetyltransferase [Rhodopirellula sp. SWK7]|nr:nourseothricin acetyltransferase [Rhodopirellula sp. SWK7]
MSATSSTTSEASAEAPAVVVWTLSTAELATALSTTFVRISPARAGIVTDQLRAVLKSQSTGRLIVQAASPAPQKLQNALLAITLLPESGDTATILHVDWVHPQKSGTPSIQSANTNFDRESTVGQDNTNSHYATLERRLGESLWQELSTILANRGMHFIQWATDPVLPPTEPLDSGAMNVANRWPQSLQFSQIGTLEYLALDCDGHGQWPQTNRQETSPPTRNQDGSPKSNAPTRDRFSIDLEPLDHDDPAKREIFEKLVKQTYIDSLDCPPLERFRTVGDIISGYQTATAYSPDQWYIIHEKSTGDSAAHHQDARPGVGCLILAQHPGPSPLDDGPENPAAVVELVYMGIAPEYRGRGYGQQIMQRITEICQRLSAERLILAVDRDNHPAIAAYRAIGMQPLFRETVWGRSVENATDA